MQTQEASSKSVRSVAGYRRILVPHDGSEMSDRALGHAAYIAKASGAEMTIMNVIETDLISPSFTLAFFGEFGKEDTAAATLEEAKGRLRNTIEGGVKQMLEQRVRAYEDVLGKGNDRTVSYEVRAGKPAEEIINASEEKGYDLIVMGSSKIVSRVRILGSTARRVLDSTKKPVLIIHE